MFNPFDVVAKELVRRDTRGWLRFLGVDTTAPVELIESDLTTLLTSAADLILQVDEPDRRYLVHLEMQTSRDATLLKRLLRYNVLLGEKFDSSVRTVLILFRREADASDLTGTYRRELPTGEVYLEFHYEIVRLWQLPVDEFLNGSLAILPLAPLAKYDLNDFPALIRQMNDRLDRDASPPVATELWASTYILSGMRLSETQVDLMKGLRNMQESTTYQAILREGILKGRDEGRDEGRVEGRVEGETTLIVHLGTMRFGPPDSRFLASLQEIADFDRLKRIAARLLDAANWEELLETE